MLGATYTISFPSVHASARDLIMHGGSHVAVTAALTLGGRSITPGNGDQQEAKICKSTWLRAEVAAATG